MLNFQAIRLPLVVPDPPESLSMQTFSLDDQPSFTSGIEDGVTLLKGVRWNLTSSSRFYQINQLVEIARSFAQDMNFSKASLTRNFNHYVSFKMLFFLTKNVFNVSTVLHLAFRYVCHRFVFIGCIFWNIENQYYKIGAPSSKRKLKGTSRKLSKRYLLLDSDAIESSRKTLNIPDKTIHAAPNLKAKTSPSYVALQPTCYILLSCMFVTVVVFFVAFSGNHHRKPIL